MNEKPMVAGGIAGAILLASLIFIIMHLSGGGATVETPDEAYFMDMETGEIFTDDIEKRPPITHNGHEAVRAYLFENPDGGDPIVGYLMKYSKEAQGLRGEQLTELPGEGMLVSRDGREWYIYGGEEFAEIMQELRDKVGGRPEFVRP